VTGNLSREARLNVAVADAVGWDDRKTLADIYQGHVRLEHGLSDEFYAALIAVAQHGARRAADDLID
jgi:hypothetical protein